MKFTIVPATALVAALLTGVPSAKAEKNTFNAASCLVVGGVVSGQPYYNITQGQYGNGGSDNVVLACPVVYDAQSGVPLPQTMKIDVWSNGCIMGVNTLKVWACKVSQSGGNAVCNQGVLEGDACAAGLKHPDVTVPVLLTGDSLFLKVMLGPHTQGGDDSLFGYRVTSP